MTSVKCEAEYRQDRCIHKLECIDPAKENGFKYRCIVCGRFLYRKNGILSL